MRNKKKNLDYFYNLYTSVLRNEASDEDIIELNNALKLRRGLREALKYKDSEYMNSRPKFDLDLSLPEINQNVTPVNPPEKLTIDTSSIVQPINKEKKLKYISKLSNTVTTSLSKGITPKQDTKKATTKTKVRLLPEVTVVGKRPEAQDNNIYMSNGSPEIVVSFDRNKARYDNIYRALTETAQPGVVSPGDPIEEYYDRMPSKEALENNYRVRNAFYNRVSLLALYAYKDKLRRAFNPIDRGEINELRMNILRNLSTFGDTYDGYKRNPITEEEFKSLQRSAYNLYVLQCKLRNEAAKLKLD